MIDSVRRYSWNLCLVISPLDVVHGLDLLRVSGPAPCSGDCFSSRGLEAPAMLLQLVGYTQLGSSEAA